jgi:hypothetical protein
LIIFSLVRFQDRHGALLPLERVFAEHLDAVKQRLDWRYRKAVERVGDARTEPAFIVHRGDGSVERLENFAPPAPVPRQRKD